MKILVCSDSHNRVAHMKNAVAALAPDLILHLGDHDYDTVVLTDAFPHIPLRAVCGNCDYGSDNPPMADFVVADKRIVMTHGHRYQVKEGLSSLIRMGQEANADLLLFGHTHRAHYEQIGTMHLCNPGSAAESCALVEILDGEIVCRHITVDSF